MKQINVQLSEKTLLQVKEIAEKEELAYTSLVRNWIVQKVREYASTANPAKMPVDAATP